MADEKKEQRPDVKWQGRKVVAPAHVDNLERDAAVLEFEHGMSRKDAEEQAYQEYLRIHHTTAAAHHLRGMRGAQASGDYDEARKHGIAYGMHLHALELDPMDQVPDEINELVDADDRKPQIKFKAHKADSLLLGQE
jgi:hypothetical protein